MPVFHTKTIQTILDPVAQQVLTESLALVLISPVPFILCKSSVRVYLVQDNATQCVCCVRVSTSGKVTKLD